MCSNYKCGIRTVTWQISKAFNLFANSRIFDLHTCSTICALFAALWLPKTLKPHKSSSHSRRAPKISSHEAKICFSEGRNVFMTHLRFLAVHCIEMDRCFASSPCMYPAFITSMMILRLYENHEKEAVASHNTEKVCYVKFLLCFRLLKWILITKRREKNISHLATRQMCSLLLQSSSCTENYFRGEKLKLHQVHHRTGEKFAQEIWSWKEINKNKSGKELGRRQSTAKSKTGGRKREREGNAIIYVVSEKGFLKVALATSCE